LAGLGVVALWPAEREPEYDGKKLSEWLEICTYQDAKSPVRQRGEEAIRHIGTNGLPWLLHWMDYEIPGWKRKLLYSKYWRTVPAPLAHRIAKRDRLAFDMLAGFRILGPAATPAIPDLMRKLDTWPHRSSDRAFGSLGYIGGDALFPLLCIATNRNRPLPLRQKAMETIAYGKFNLDTGKEDESSPFVPVLTPYLVEDGMDEATMTAIMSRCGTTPDVALQILTQAESSKSAHVREWAVHLVGTFRTNATPEAIPELLKFLRDPDLKVREEATNAILKIAPEGLTNRVKDF
jgi:hypothetical protein